MPDDLTPDEGTDEQDPVTPQVDPRAPGATDPEPPVEEPIPATDPVDPAPAPVPATPAAPSVEERYRQSTSEALILNAKNKGLESTLNKLTSEDTPTEAELQGEYPDYKNYNAVTQKLMAETLAGKKARMRLNLQFIEQQATRRLETDLDTLTAQPKYAALDGDRAFRQFVLQPKHKDVDIETLADAYLVRTGKIQPSDEPNPAPPAPKAPPANSGVPRGSGGPRGQVKTAKITLAEAAILRKTNWKEYMRHVKAGNIEELE
jgi:hypothetical protein